MLLLHYPATKSRTCVSASMILSLCSALLVTMMRSRSVEEFWALLWDWNTVEVL